MSFVLCILDGWGYSEKKEYNAIAKAYTPNYDFLLKNHPHTLLECFGESVGLPEGQMGNSEVGHITIGAGRIVYQDLPKISKSIESGEFAKKQGIKDVIRSLQNNGGICHIIGLISDGGVHSHIDHIIALNQIMSSQKVPVKLHAVADGRDVAPQSVIKYLEKLHAAKVDIASLMGRFYCMDRDKRWDRTQKAYDAIVNGEAPKYSDIISAVTESYNNDVDDEFIKPIVADGYSGVKSGDAIIIANFRADRVRQISHALCDIKFEEFKTRSLELSHVISMTEYSEVLAKMMQPLFVNETPKNTLGEVISSLGMKQLRAAETEKYAHVTYFFNGGREQPFEGEDRILVPSPKVATYDLQPEMSAQELTDKLVEAIRSKKYNFICINFANPDMVGHSGNIESTILAINKVDECLGRITNAVQEISGEMLVTADHGNAEEMMDEVNHQPLTSHTLNKVPLIYFGSKKLSLNNGGLSNVAPSILELMGIKKPAEMNARSLVQTR